MKKIIIRKWFSKEMQRQFVWSKSGKAVKTNEMYYFSLYVIIKHLIYCVIQITAEGYETFAWLIVSV